MDIAGTLAKINALSVDDRIQLVQAIWDSIGAESAQIELTEAQKQELSHRLADHQANPDAVIAWETVKTQALARAKNNE